MSKLYFNNQNKIECPTLVLQNKSNHNYGAIIDYNSLTYKQSFNAPNEISFTVYKGEHPSEQQKKIWDNITDLKVVYIPEFKEKFEISVQKTISNTKTKAITGTALAEAELSQILLRNIEINTELDIENDKYDTNFRTVFYRDIDDINNEEYMKIWNGDKKYTVYEEDGSINAEKTIELRRGILYSSSLLHRLLDKAVNYSIGHVDDSLKSLNLIKSFSISSQYIYNELVGEISEEYGVLFKFDSMNKTVSAYDLYNTCYDCGYRDDFAEECPKCGSKNFGGQYGISTPILVSAENLATQLTKNGDSGSVKTYFKVEGGDDLINSVIAAINPTGNAYIFYLPDYMLEEMPEGMRDRLDSYNLLKNKFVNNINYLEEEGFSLSSENVDNYNTIVRWLADYDPDDEFSLIGSQPVGESSFEYNTMIGYDSTTKLYYDLVDLESVLKTSLMPTQKTDKQTMTEAFNLITVAFHPIDESEKVTVAVSNLKSVAETSVNNAVIGVVEVVIDTSLFDSEVVSGTYTYDSSTDTGSWTGTIRLTNKETLENEKPETMDRSYTLDITDNVLEYTKQKIKKNMARTDINEIQDLTSLDEKTYSGEPVIINGQLCDTWLKWFENELKYYSADNLEQLVTEFEACRSVIAELQQDLDEGCETDKSGHLIGYEKKPSDHFYSIYTDRLELIKAELANKENMLNQLYKLYKYDSSTNYSTGEVPVIRRKVNSLLDFQKCMEGSGNEENYWSVFCSYLREDTYTNENYISTDLSNRQLIDRANELIEVAYGEIQKSAYNQYTISSTMNNLFALKEFQPFRDNFDVGNWIRVDVDDEIHKLRLLSYQINFDELQEIDVEFSSVIHSPSYISDVKSVFNSVSNISSSYDAVTKQVNTTSELLDDISGRLENGLDSSTTKIVNDGLVEEIIIDKNGILGRAYDDITGEYDNCQYKFIRNGLYMTKDSWKSIYNAIGRFRYDTGEKDENKKAVYATAYGIKADTIVGDLIFGKQLVIRNEANNLRVDANGLFIEDSQHRSAVTINPNDEEGKLFRVSSGYDSSTDKYKKDVMYIDGSGNGYFTGEIKSQKGNIGGWDVGEYSIFSENNYVGDEYKVSLQVPHQETIMVEDDIKIQLNDTILSVQNTEKGYFPIKITRDKIKTDNGDTYNSTMTAGKLEMYYGSEAYCEISGQGIELRSSKTSNYATVSIKEAEIKVDGKEVSVEGHTHSQYATTSSLSSYLPLSGGTISGNLSVHGTLITRNFSTTRKTTSSQGYSFLLCNGDYVNDSISEKDDYGSTSNYVYLAGGADSTGIFLRSYPVYDRKYTSNSNQVVITSAGTFGRYSSSSIRYKNSVQYFSNDHLRTINKNKTTEKTTDSDILSVLNIPVVKFKYNEGYITGEPNYDYDKDEVGFIADDIAKICPDCATYITNDKGEQIAESWDERKMIPRMLYVLQMHEQKICFLQEEIDNLKEEIRLLKESRGE